MIKIPIDPTNPGHVFAAVGLTELALRITGEARGYFDNLHYILLPGDNVTMSELVSRIKKLEIGVEDTENKDTPLSLAGLRLDWWQRPSSRDSIAGNMKTWAGQTKIAEMAKAAQCGLNDTEEILHQRSLAYLPNSKKPSSLPSFDAQRSRSTLDTGYSPNELQHKIMPAPSVEFLALIGLQRAWPAKVKDSHAYYTWSCPLPPVLFPAAISGYIDPLAAYTFAIQKDGEFSRLQPAQPFHQNNNL